MDNEGLEMNRRAPTVLSFLPINNIDFVNVSNGVTAKKLRKKCRSNAIVCSCTRLQILLLILCGLATVLTSILLTYIITKGQIKHNLALGNENDVKLHFVAAAHSGNQNSITDNENISLSCNVDKNANVNKYDNEFNTILSDAKALTAKKEKLGEFNSASKIKENNLASITPTAAELRLSQNLFPIWYNLTMQVYLPGFVAIEQSKNLTFDAILILKFRVVNTTDVIELNALKLTFPTNLMKIEVLHNMDLNISLLEKISVVGFQVNETLEKIFIQLDKKLVQEKEYFLKLPFKGPISTKLSGLYLSQFTTKDGQHRFIATTQMEPTDARRMVPCFDEPAFKAIWRLQVTHPTGSQAVSNAIELAENEKTDNVDWILTRFDETLPMSSYLLALVVSDFKYVEGYTNKKTRFRVWTRSEAINQTSYALSSGIRVLEFFEDYYGIPFPLPKQDMMAFPDFSAGAMENWGLVTYREKYLLFSEDVYTLSQKLYLATVVAHELAHQWFGNLVTMKWWSDLWLNEGFATLVEYMGTNAISKNEYRMNELFVKNSLTNALNRDARATSHPLYFDIDRAEDVSEAFDTITYDKGASVLKMIQTIMGEDTFKKGLNIYLNRYKYHNADHNNLWNALTEAVPDKLKSSTNEKFNILQFAQSWTEQMGYPVVIVQRLDDSRVELSQQRFKLDESALEKPKFRNPKLGYKWDIPIWFRINETQKSMIWLKKTTIIEDIGKDDVLVVNSESNGFYRVQYSKKTLDNIAKQLLNNHNSIPVKGRARIIDDAFTLAEAGRIPYEAALNLTRYLVKEKEYLVWDKAFSGLRIIQRYFGDEPEADYFKAYVKQIIGKLFDQAMNDIINTKKYFNTSKFFETLLNEDIIKYMCSLRESKCIEQILNIYQKQFVQACNKENQISSECSVVPVALRGLTYCEGVQHGTQKDFEMIMRLYEKEHVQVERERLMHALACSRDTHILKKLLVIASNINSTFIRLQDKSVIFSSVANKVYGQKLVFDFFVDHWSQIYRDFKEQQSLLRTLVASSIAGNSQRLIDEVELFMKKNDKTTRNLDIFKQRLEVIKTNRKWIINNFKSLSEWFRQQQEKHEYF